MTELEFQHLSEQMDLPPFLHPSYLDIICGEENWDTIVYTEGDIQAIWFFWLKKKWGVPYITMPALAKYMGPYFSKNMNLFDKKKAFDTLSRQLPKHAYLYQQCHPSTQDLIAKIPNTYKRSFGKTHLLDLTPTMDSLLQQMSGNNRRSIRKYQDEIEVLTNEIDGLYEIIVTSLPDASMLGINRVSFEQLCHLIIEKKIGFTTIIHLQGEIIAGSICLISNTKAYYLLNGNKRLSGSIYPGVQIIWKVIQHLKSLNMESLDLLGSSIESIAKVWTSIGATPTDYPIIERKSALYRLLSKP